MRLEGAVGARRLLERCGGGAVRLEAALDNDVIWMTHHIAQEIALLEALRAHFLVEGLDALLGLAAGL